MVLLPWVVLTALLHLKFFLVLGNSQAPSAWTMSKCGVSMADRREFKIKIFKWFLWSPVLPILIALASVARVENHVSSSKVQACLVPPDGKGIKALDLQPIKVMQTCLISPCLLSIQYWLPPWLWHGHRPTGLCKSSLFPGLWGKIVSGIEISIGVTDTGYIYSQ